MSLYGNASGRWPMQERLRQLLGREEEKKPVFEMQGFKSGDVIRHKVSHKQAVIIYFEEDDDGMRSARVSKDFWKNDEFWCRLAEIELVPPVVPPAPPANDTVSR